MAEPVVWSNVSVAIQSALGAAKTISAITKASPGVVSSTAHGFTDGDLVLLKVQGMRQLNYMIARVDGAVTDAFDLEGIDTTSFGTFISGTAEEITFGTEVATFTDVNATGGEAAGIPTTTIHEDEDREIPGNKSVLVYSFGSQWIADDAALLAIQVASDGKLIKGIKITFSNGAYVVFAGYLSSTLAPTGSSGQVASTPVSMRLKGRLKAYAAA